LICKHNFILGVQFIAPTCVLMLLMLCFTSIAAAQDENEQLQQCAAVLNAAVASTQLECGEQPDGTVCYGSISAGATGSSEIAETFSLPGNVAPLTNLDTLTTGAANIEEGAWGIARLTPRLNFTDETLPIYVYGDVTLQNNGNPAADVPSRVISVTFAEGANVRAEPDVFSEQIGLIYVGNQVRATGVIESGAWVRILDEDSNIAWVNATVFNSDDLTDLAVVEPNEDTSYGSMQAFDIETGRNNNDDCLLIPPNGVLIQTPEDSEPARLQINGIDAQLPPETTVFLSTSNGNLQVDVLEGEADFDVRITGGQRGTFTDEAITVDGFPLEDYDALARLPIDRLPRPIFVALDFSLIVNPPQPEPLAGTELDDTCAIAANAPVNLREEPSPGGRVRYVMPINASANPTGRAQGTDGALWWRLAENVWVSSNAVFAAGACGRLPLFAPVP